MKKVLLIGKTSQLGSELMKDAASFGFEIAGFKKDELDVTNQAQIVEKIKTVKPDILINTSAYHVVPMCEKNPLPAMDVNFIAVQNLARICKEYNTAFVTYSTDYVFDGKRDAPYEENDTPNPLQVYGMSKLAGEYAALHSYPDGTFIIRTCGLYGGLKGSPEKRGNFVLNILQQVREDEKKEIEVISDQMVSPTYAGDLSKATFTLLKNKAEPGIYHLVNDGYCSWHEFAKEILKLAGIDKKIKPIKTRNNNGILKRPKFSALKSAKAKVLGIKMPPWQEALKYYINFLENS